MLRNSIITWNKQSTDMQKIQHSYVLLVVLLVLVAGIVAIVANTVPSMIGAIAFVIATTFVVNFVTWSLLKTTVVDRLPKNTPRKTTRSR